MTTTNLIEMVTKHGEAEGRADYLGRAQDVARGTESPEWAWPLSGADEAYLGAVGTGAVCRAIGIDPALWDEVSDAWCEAFTRGYRAAYTG